MPTHYNTYRAVYRVNTTAACLVAYDSFVNTAHAVVADHDETFNFLSPPGIEKRQKRRVTSGVCTK